MLVRLNCSVRFMIILALVFAVELFAAPKPQLSTVEQVRNHWAFKPILMPSIPSVKSSWAGNQVDKFVLKRLQDKGWKPSGRADRRTLIRRAAMDLTGLMPSLAEVRSFQSDDSPDAWAKLLDQLLASPHYGERWGRHWLDVARFADNKGYVGVGVDRLYPYSYTYRDYVVRAFNEDLPYDRFIIEQIAADSLELGEDKRALAAMGFLTLGRRFLNRQDDIIDDRIDVVTRGLMGFTVTCARCHDHKYDPIPTADYYSLHGVFASSDEPKNMPLLGEGSLPLQHGDYLKEKAKREKAIQDLIRDTYQKGLAKLRSRAGEYMLAVHQAETQKLNRDGLDKWLTQKKLNVVAFENWKRALAKWKAEKHPVFLAWHRQGGEGNPLIARKENMKSQAEAYGKLFQKVDQKWVEQQKANPLKSTLKDEHLEAIRQVLYSKDTPATVPEKLKEENRNSLFFGVRNQIKGMRSKLSKLAATHPGAPPRAHVLKDKVKPVEPYVYIRGGRGNRGPKVARQFLEHLSKNRKPFLKGSGRLELAEAIADPDNPLTARVLVNRVWAQHFGQGLVRTPSDFGLRALPPSHPQLLDYLAFRFVNEGWSIKKLHRWIMSSSTYRQSSNGRVDYLEIDPANRLLWKMNRQRISFEALRDTVLQASGQLDLTLGGRPVKIEVHPTSNRRTIYGFIDRQNLPPFFRVFDFANPDTHCPERYENIVPQQSLYLMNSPFILDQSKKVSQMVAKHAPFGQARVKVLYNRMLQRDPKATEIVDALRFINAAPEDGQSKAFSQLAQILFLSNEFRYLD
jgi:hypothetical protein